MPHSNTSRDAQAGPTAAARTGASVEQQVLLSTLPPSRAQKRLALAIVLVLLVALCATAPFATMQVGYVRAFIPAYATAVYVVSSITSALLYIQYYIIRSRALLVISCGYLFIALITIPWALTFPDLFAQTNMTSAIWDLLSRLWHLGFPLFVICYALLKDEDTATGARARPWSFAVLLGIAGVVVAADLAVWLAGTISQLAPGTLPVSTAFERLQTYWNGVFLLLTLVSLALLWSRRRSVLDLWLMVVMCGWLIELCLIFLFGHHYIVGWYAARVYSLISATLVLAILLSETALLYARLARTVVAENREREARMMTMDVLSASIAHEMNQPLASVATSADAGLRWLVRATPDLEEVKASLEQIRNSAHRASEVITSIRAMIKKERRNRSPVDLNDLVREVIQLVGDELRRQRVAVELHLDEHLPKPEGDRVQLRQVLINLITNAIEAMAENRHFRVLRIRTAVDESDGALIAVDDNGTGIDPKNIDTIFNPLFTTKSNGMGMGLSICRSIVEGHYGRIWASAGAAGGTVFQLVLPIE
jgi:signal transduction histidine kinase